MARLSERLYAFTQESLRSACISLWLVCAIVCGCATSPPYREVNSLPRGPYASETGVPIPSADPRARLIITFLKAMSAGDVNLVMSCFSNDFLQTHPATRETITNIKSAASQSDNGQLKNELDSMEFQFLGTDTEGEIRFFSVGADGRISSRKALIIKEYGTWKIKELQ